MRRLHSRLVTRVGVAGALLWLATAGARGQGTAPELSLAQARREAAENGWATLAARAAVRQAEGQQLQSHALPNPSLSFSAQKLNVTPVGGGGSTSDLTAGVSQLVELGGKRRSRMRGADSGLAAVRGQLALTRVSLDAAVIKAYAAAVAADENARITRESAGSLARAATIAEARYAAGEISAAERDQTRIAAGRFAADARSSEAAATQARVGLQLLLGLPAPDGKVRLSDGLDALWRLVVAAAAEPSAERDVAALEARGDVLAARALAEQAKAQADLQRAQRVPDLSLFVQYESDRPGNTNTVGAGVAIPLPLFDRSRGAIAAADAAREQAEHEARRVRAQASADLAAARTALAAALDRRRLLLDELLPRAQSVRATVAFAYEKGLASLLELLEAERSLNDVRLAAVSSLGEALSTAADVAAARGETLP
jgi:cobalt-zinc-cadmium efflux system outer membrane protein